MPEQTVLQLGAVAILFAIAIREFFSYLKSRNVDGNSSKGNVLNSIGNDINSLILEELQKMNGNHLHTIQEVIERGNDRVVAAFNAHNESEHNDSMKIVELLGEIRGNLNSLLK